jgi:8-oxo-dGTP diphosphatase
MRTKTRSKRTRTSTGSIVRVVAALIVRDHQVLACQRTRHQTLPLKWEFPGGKIETGEQPRSALQRELQEELGIVAKIGDEVSRIHHAYKDGKQVELRFYRVSEFQGEVENRIFRDVRWVPLRSLPQYDFLAADVELVKQIAAGKVL